MTIRPRDLDRVREAALQVVDARFVRGPAEFGILHEARGPAGVGGCEVDAEESEEIADMAVDEVPRWKGEERIEIAHEAFGLAGRGVHDAQHPFVIGKEEFVFRENEACAEEGEFLEREKREVTVLLAERLAVIPPPGEELRGEALEALRLFLDGEAHDRCEK